MKPVCYERPVGKCECRAQYQPLKQALNSYLPSTRARGEERPTADDDVIQQTAFEERLWIDGDPLPKTAQQNRITQPKQGKEETQQQKHQKGQQRTQQAQQNGKDSGTRSRRSTRSRSSRQKAPNERRHS